MLIVGYSQGQLAFRESDQSNTNAGWQTPDGLEIPDFTPDVERELSITQFKPIVIRTENGWIVLEMIEVSWILQEHSFPDDSVLNEMIQSVIYTQDQSPMGHQITPDTSWSDNRLQCSRQIEVWSNGVEPFYRSRDGGFYSTRDGSLSLLTMSIRVGLIDLDQNSYFIRTQTGLSTLSTDKYGKLLIRPNDMLHSMVDYEHLLVPIDLISNGDGGIDLRLTEVVPYTEDQLNYLRESDLPLNEYEDRGVIVRFQQDLTPLIEYCGNLFRPDGQGSEIINRADLTGELICPLNIPEYPSIAIDNWNRAHLIYLKPDNSLEFVCSTSTGVLPLTVVDSEPRRLVFVHRFPRVIMPNMIDDTFLTLEFRIAHGVHIEINDPFRSRISRPRISRPQVPEFRDNLLRDVVQEMICHQYNIPRQELNHIDGYDRISELECRRLFQNQEIVRFEPSILLQPFVGPPDKTDQRVVLLITTDQRKLFVQTDLKLFQSE